MERFVLTLSSWHNDLQKHEIKCFPLSDTMLEGVPCLEKTCTRKIMAKSSASMSWKVGMNNAIFVRRQTMTRIVLWLSDSGRPSMKSIEIESQGREVTGRNQWGPNSLWWTNLLRQQVEHECM